MFSNRVKRNIWLTLAIISILAVADRIIGVANGTSEWWHLASTAVTTALCFKFYLCYRRQVKNGNLFGKVDPLKKVDLLK